MGRSADRYIAWRRRRKRKGIWECSFAFFFFLAYGGEYGLRDDASKDFFHFGLSISLSTAVEKEGSSYVATAVAEGRVLWPSRGSVQYRPHTMIGVTGTRHGLGSVPVPGRELRSAVRSQNFIPAACLPS